MKRLLLLTILIGLLFTSPNSFAQSSKPKRATIKYENGVKYVGEVRKVSPKVFNGRAKIKHGNGIMYFANGDQLNGTWYTDQCRYGTYKFANGDIFVGEINNSKMLQDGSMCFSSDRGKITFASEGTIKLGYKAWHYPDNCNFTGTIKDKTPYTGTFDCTLTTKDGDRFTGKLSNGHIGYGEIEYANGDTFEGNFKCDKPSSGKYRYGNITNVTKASHKWEIPAGCVFEGKFESSIATFTGTVNMEITNAAGDKFIGRLYNGAPDEGTMVFAATGHTETGKWKDGLSPREYQIQQRAKERALDSITKAFVAQQRIKDSLKLADEKQKHQTEEQKKQAFIRKYGQRYGSLIYQGKLELGMTQQMCQEVIDIKSYDIGKSIRSGHRVETWTFNKDKQDMQVAAAMTQLSGEEAMALALLMGFADSVGASTPKYSVLVFTDGKLTSLY